VDIDSHDDKAWRDTLLKVAAILCERQPDSQLGYRLRRHALWQNITSVPQAESDGRTPLAAVSADMVDDYKARLASADMVLWQQVEKACCWHRTGWTVITCQRRPRNAWATTMRRRPSARKSSVS
jgi:type VI secretion system protein VasJ